MHDEKDIEQEKQRADGRHREPLYLSEENFRMIAPNAILMGHFATLDKLISDPVSAPQRRPMTL